MKGNIKVELDLSDYATRADLKNPAGADSSKFAKQDNSASLKLETDKLDIAKSETTPVALSALSDVVKNNVVKKTECDELVKKVNTFKTTDTSDLVKKTDYNTKAGGIRKKILDHDHSKYITTQEFKKLMADNFAARLAQAKLGLKMIFVIS